MKIDAKTIAVWAFSGIVGGLAFALFNRYVLKDHAS